jgi:hypothetical protein
MAARNGSAGYRWIDRDTIQSSMGLENLTQGALDLVSAHPYVTGAMLAVVGVLSYFKIKLVLKAVTACLILGAIAYIVLFIFNLAATGVENTEKLRGNPNQAIDNLLK